MRKCTINGCPNKHEAKGFCKKHYKSFLKYGDPLQTEKNKQEKMENKKQQKPKSKRLIRDESCSIEGCEDRIKAKGLCDKHYQRKFREGKHKTNRVEKGSIKKCLVFECERPHKAKGLCGTHYKYYQLNGTPYLPKTIKICGKKDCNKIHFGNGLCSFHLAEWNKILRKHNLYDYKKQKDGTT